MKRVARAVFACLGAVFLLGAAPSGGVAPKSVHRGAQFTNAALKPLAEVVAEPSKYSDLDIQIRGEVERVCKKKGCWMELSDAGHRVRITFKDYAFFVPTDASGQALVEGRVEIRRLKPEMVAHLKAEGARIASNAKGEAIEIGFVATSVALGGQR